MTGSSFSFYASGEIDGSAVEKEFFRQSGFSGINVRRDANTDMFHSKIRFHVRVILTPTIIAGFA